MSSRPMDQGNYRGMPAQQPESTSVIDQFSNFDGTYNSARDLRVEGQVKGTIVCKGTLHVAQGATVKATVEAEAISVAGELEGEVNCRGRLELLQSGRVKGQISTQSLVIHEGAVYEGDLEMGANAGRSRRSRAERDRNESSEAPVAAASTEPIATESVPDVDTPIVPEVDTLVSRPSSFIRRFGGADAQPTSPAPEAPEE